MTFSQFFSITYSIIYLLSPTLRIVFFFSYLNPKMPIFFHSVPGREGEQLAPQRFLLYLSLGSYIISLGFPKVPHYVCKNKICMFNFKFIISFHPASFVTSCSALHLLPGYILFAFVTIVGNPASSFLHSVLYLVFLGSCKLLFF